MSEKGQPEGAQKLTEAFAESYRAAMRNIVDAQQRNLGLAQGWVESFTGVLESQAETNRALTRAVQSYANVVEEALKSQERTNRALSESLDSYRELAERTTALQERNEELVRGFFEGVTGELRSQTENNQALAREFVEGSERQMEAFESMFREAVDSYTSLINAPFALYQKNLEAFRRGDG